MSETPIYDALAAEYKLAGRLPDSLANNNLTDYEIENPHAAAGERFDLTRDEFDVRPPVWEGPDFTHEEVQAPATHHVEAQPSIIEQHNNMTDEQNIAYIGALTPHIAQMRSHYVLAA